MSNCIDALLFFTYSCPILGDSRLFWGHFSHSHYCMSRMSLPHPFVFPDAEIKCDLPDYGSKLCRCRYRDMWRKNSRRKQMLSIWTINMMKAHMTFLNKRMWWTVVIPKINGLFLKTVSDFGFQNHRILEIRVSNIPLLIVIRVIFII